MRTRRPTVLRRLHAIHESSPGEEVVGGLFFDFEAVRTESRGRSAQGRRCPVNRRIPWTRYLSKDVRNERSN